MNFLTMPASVFPKDRRFVTGLTLITALLALTAPQPAAADCRVLDRQIRSAIASKALDKFGPLADQVRHDMSCSITYRRKVPRVLSLTYLKIVQQRARAANWPALPLEGVQKAAAIASPWQVLAKLGDVYYTATKWGAAKRAFDQALDDMRNTVVNPKVPPAAAEARIRKLVYQAQVLAPPHYQEAFRCRCFGSNTGATDPASRNFKHISVPVPVRFDTSSARLTDFGREAVKDMYRFLTLRKIASVHIIGHCDERGGHALNDRLSLARAKTVQQALRQFGYRGKIRVSGRGKREPYQPDRAERYTKQELRAFQRRIEFEVDQTLAALTSAR